MGLAVQAERGPAAGLGGDGQGDRVVAVVTVLPPASSTVTTGWVAQACPSTPPPGWVVKASWVAAPMVM